MNRFKFIFSLAFAVVVLVAGVANAGAQDSPFIPWIEGSSRFGAMVPADWQIQGTAHDLFGLGVLPQLVAISPDGTQVVTVGSEHVFAFVEPDARLGIQEGVTLPSGLTALSQLQPVDFLREYLEMWLVDSGTCSAIESTPVSGTPVTQAGYLAGEVHLTCAYEGGTATGRYYAGIYTIEDAHLGQLWIVGDLFGYLADAGQEAEAERVLATIVQTLSYAPHETLVTEGYGDSQAPAYAPREMDAFLAQQMNTQMNQMVNSHFNGMMVDQMNWFQQNQEMIMGIRTEYDSQYEVQWVWEQR